jgi:hypothetical protein
VVEHDGLPGSPGTEVRALTLVVVLEAQEVDLEELPRIASEAALSSGRSSLRLLICSSKTFSHPNARRSRRCSSGFWSFFEVRT